MRLFNLLVHAFEDLVHGQVRVEVETTVTVERPLPAPVPAPVRTAPKPIDVELALDELASQCPLGALDWRHSVVDLLKLMGLDSSGYARRALAGELGYPGQMQNLSDGMAALNIWLHREVLIRLGERGIPLPQA